MGWSCPSPCTPCATSPTFSSLQVPLEDHVIYSGNLFHYIEENKKWRNRFCVVPHNYGLVLYENKLVRGIPHRWWAQPTPSSLPFIHHRVSLLRPMSGTCRPVC